MHRKLFAVLIMAVIFFIPGFIRMNNDNLDSIVNKICYSGGKIQKIIVEGHTTIKSNDNISDIANNIYKNAGIEDKVKKTHREASVAIKGSNFCIKVIKMPTEHRYYISFELSQHEPKENINNIRETIFRGFAHYNQEPEVSCLLIARYSHYMTRSQMKQSAREILASAGGKVVKGMCDRNLVSYHAYMPKLAEKIILGDDYTNINLAMRTVKEENYTYLFIGSPIIEVEY